MKEYRQREELCDACNYYIKTCRKSKHVKTKTHIENLNNKKIHINLENQYSLTDGYVCCNEKILIYNKVNYIISIYFLPIFL